MLDCLLIGSATKDTLLMVEAPPASDQRIAASAVVLALIHIFEAHGGADILQPQGLLIVLRDIVLCLCDQMCIRDR